MSASVAVDRARLPSPSTNRVLANRPPVARARAGTPAGPSVEVAGRPMPVLELQRAAGNRAAAIAIGSATRRPSVQRRPQEGETEYASGDSDNPQVPPPGTRKPRKMTGYLGMNPDARKELRKLEGAAGERNVLSSMGDAALEEKLSQEPAIADFVANDLQIPEDRADQRAKAVDALTKAAPAVRDALAELMRWMRRAEDGQIVLDRLVLSGHSNGFELWGTGVPGSKQHPGVLVVDQDLTNVAAAFPGAAKQVRSVMFSACETVGAVETVVRVFPNVDSVWSYAGFSPDIDSGSSDHVAGWERASAGSGSPSKRDAKGATAIWTRKDKWLVKDPGKGDIQTLYTNAMAEFGGPVQQVLRGQKPIVDAELNGIYLRIGAVLAHPGVTAAQKGTAHGAMDSLLRLRHWEAVRNQFETYRSVPLAPAYTALGVTQPEWRTITRAQLYEHVKQLRKAWEAHPDESAAQGTVLTYVVEGLYKLADKKVVPEGWIH